MFSSNFNFQIISRWRAGLLGIYACQIWNFSSTQNNKLILILFLPSHTAVSLSKRFRNIWQLHFSLGNSWHYQFPPSFVLYTTIFTGCQEQPVRWTAGKIKKGIPTSWQREKYILQFVIKFQGWNKSNSAIASYSFQLQLQSKHEQLTSNQNFSMTEREERKEAKRIYKDF